MVDLDTTIHPCYPSWPYPYHVVTDSHCKLFKTASTMNSRFWVHAWNGSRVAMDHASPDNVTTWVKRLSHPWRDVISSEGLGSMFGNDGSTNPIPNISSKPNTFSKFVPLWRKSPFPWFFSSHSLSFGERTDRLLLLLSMPFFSTLSSSCSHPILSQVSFLFPTACHRTCSDAPFVYPNIGVCLIPPNFHNYRKTILYYSHFEANLRFPFHPLAMGMSFFFRLHLW